MTLDVIGRPVPGPTPLRIAVLAAREDDDRVADRWSDAVGDLISGDLRARYVRAIVRLRPLLERGTLAEATPFQAVLA